MRIDKSTKEEKLFLKTVVIVKNRCPIYRMNIGFSFEKCQQCSYKGTDNACAWRQISYTFKEIATEYETADEEDLEPIPICEHHTWFDRVISATFRFPCALCHKNVVIRKERQSLLIWGDSGTCEQCGTVYTFIKRHRPKNQGYKNTVFTFAIPAVQLKDKGKCK